MPTDKIRILLALAFSVVYAAIVAALTLIGGIWLVWSALIGAGAVGASLIVAVTWELVEDHLATRRARKDRERHEAQRRQWGGGR